MKHLSSAVQQSQRGASLIMVLLILIVITVLGVGAAQIGMLGERSARFDRDYQIALQAAEAALMDAEFDIRGPNADANSRVANFDKTSKLGFEAGCGNTGTTRGLCAPAATGKPIWASVNFLDESNTARSVAFGTFTGRAFDAGSTGIRPARVPRYVIEALDDKATGENAAMDGGETPKVLYRVTAMGFGPREETQAVVQIEFRKE